MGFERRNSLVGPLLEGPSESANCCLNAVLIAVLEYRKSTDFGIRREIIEFNSSKTVRKNPTDRHIDVRIDQLSSESQVVLQCHKRDSLKSHHDDLEIKNQNSYLYL